MRFSDFLQDTGYKQGDMTLGRTPHALNHHVLFTNEFINQESFDSCFTGKIIICNGIGLIEELSGGKGRS